MPPLEAVSEAFVPPSARETSVPLLTYTVPVVSGNVMVLSAVGSVNVKRVSLSFADAVKPSQIRPVAANTHADAANAGFEARVAE